MTSNNQDRLPIPGPGRNTKYKTEYADQAKKLALLGLTDLEMADFFGVAESTVHKWKLDFPAFSESIREGKVVADAEVALSLYKRATGEHVEIEKLVKDSNGNYARQTLKTYVEPDTAAIRLWLMNRQKDKWRDKVVTEHTGTIETVSKEQRDASVAAATRADS